ncbi:GGDEF domain-containing protein [Sphingomicrobium arenosum]|uniref:GGDEF domain-containing protein n=1 Tax=Sphingomicrobium arenosum TaxID=2233861 RepID=UPI00223FB992|nr:GGDEF domain-containing protein [Sphingomicrobium arenosum]
MTQTISVLSVQLGIFIFLALKCCALYAAMRRESSLGWLTGALLFCAALALALEAMPTSRWEVSAAIIAMPCAIFCISQAVRLVTGSQDRHPKFWAAIAGLSMLATLLLFLGAPYLYVAVFLKGLLGVATLEPAYRLATNRERNVLDYPLVGLLGGIALVFFARIPWWLSNFDASTDIGVFISSNMETRALLATGLLASAIVLLLITRGLSQLIGELRFRMARDPDTGLYNREAFREQVALARGRGGVVAFCDIDHFKQVNDRFGHASGDKAIAAFAAILRDAAPVAGRMGGDEFALYLPGLDLDKAQSRIDQARRRFAAVRIEGMDKLASLTASFGLAPHRRGDLLADTLQRADGALYAAKSRGRNCTVVAGSDQDTAPRDVPRIAIA